MTLADVVFPAFLFIVGVSIPLAFERGRNSRSTWAQLGHILTRTLALLFMGLVQLNGERDQRLGGPMWETLAFIGLICAWIAVPQESGSWRSFLLGLKGLGVVGLLALLAIFRGEPHATEFPFLGLFEDWDLVPDRVVGNPWLDRLGVSDRIDPLAHLGVVGASG